MLGDTRIDNPPRPFRLGASMPAPTVLFLLLLWAFPARALVFSGPVQAADPGETVSLPGVGPIDLRGVVMVRSPFGQVTSGALLEGGRYVLTAGHGVVPYARHPGGTVEIHGRSGSQILAWKRIIPHPDYASGEAWDVALIELDGHVDPTHAPGYAPRSSAAQLPELIVRTGWGHTGHGRHGDQEKPGTLTLGLNRHELRATPPLAALLGAPEKDLPFLFSDFDPPATERAEDALTAFTTEAGIPFSPTPATPLECHPGNGDSGAPVLVVDGNGRTRLAAIQLGRFGRSADLDRHTNGSWGEIAVDLDITRLAPWLRTETSPPTIETKQPHHK